MQQDPSLISACRQAWDALAPLRARRARCKDFAYGRQWDDTLRLASGRIVSERQQSIEAGRIPVTNNLIGRMLRQIIGHYRRLATASPGVSPEGVALDATPTAAEEADARALEEFLISGVALQRVKGPDPWLPGSEVAGYSPQKLFFQPFAQPDASDCRFVGLLHDLPLTLLATRFAGGDLDILGRLTLALRGSAAAWVPGDAVVSVFDQSDYPGLIRVVEVWHRSAVPLCSVYDPSDGRLLEGEFNPSLPERLDALNRNRSLCGEPQIVARTRMRDCWQQSWLLPDGTLLARRTFDAASPLPIVMRLHPMVDGEVHSLVESVIDQQKFVNRLVGLLDEILGASAKGAVLYPVDQLPDGMTWAELRRLWSSPSAILPFKRTSKSIQPRQISAPGSCTGATELLRTQLALFDDISGSGGIISGSGRQAAGADMARLQRDGATIAILDILSAFREFTSRRDSLL